MKWLVFVMTLLAITAFTRAVYAKPPRNLVVSDSEVAQIHTAVGYTTMLQFDSRPTSVVLGDQDAFKVEYVGTGIAIKPLLPRAATNIFIFTDYDRFNFRLISGPAAEADYLVRVKKKNPSYPVEVSSGNSNSSERSSSSQGDSRIIEKPIRKRVVCGGFSLTVSSIAWPESRTALLIRLRIEKLRKQEGELRFEPGDLALTQLGRPVPIETLQLQGMSFTRQVTALRGMMVIREADLDKKAPLTVGFSPDFLKAKNPKCLSVTFSRSGTRLSSKPIPKVVQKSK